MESSHPTSDLPAIKRLPFAESVQQLHRYNLHVAQVCLTSSQTHFQKYKENKERYDREVQQREEHAKAMESVEEGRKKSLQARQRENLRRNQENLSKIEHLLDEKRNKMAKKQQQLMEEGSARRQDYLDSLTRSFHHSQDRRDRIKQRQEKELQRSLLLLQQNQQKVRFANDRKIEILEQTKTSMRQKNESNATQNCRQQESQRRNLQLQRLVLKYDAVGRHLSGLDSQLEKRAADKKKEEDKVMEKHRKKRSELHEETLRRIEEDGKKDQAKIEKALQSKYQHIEQSVSSLESKRKQRQQQLMYNTFYLQEEVGKRMEAILHKHHSSQVSLMNTKAQKEYLHSSNLQDTFRATMRS